MKTVKVNNVDLQHVIEFMVSEGIDFEVLNENGSVQFTQDDYEDKYSSSY